MRYNIRSKVWITHNDKMLIGDGRAKLLRAIMETGSLNQAAKSLGISYKKAWTLVQSINDHGEEPSVVGSAGGSGGGGTRLTAYGIKLLESYTRINASCWQHLNEQLDDLDV